jgi:uncharacterized membrane protein YoaK (UPF0700 family)
MSSTSTRSVAIRNGLLLLLACAAGAIDAISYLGLGRVFTANMTGNTVLLGLAFGEANYQEALRASLALVGFFGGAAFGVWVVEKGPSAGLWPRSVTVALSLEWGLLLVFAAGWLYVGGEAATFATRGPLIALSALAMGVQSAAARRLEVSGVATTYITGTVTTLAAWLMRWLGGGGASVSARPHAGTADAGTADAGAPRQARRAVGLLAAVWVIYIGGAMAAGACVRLGPEWAVLFPLALMLIVIVTAAVRWRQ